MAERSINQPDSRVKSVKKQVTFITIEMSAEIAGLLRVAIGSAGDGGIDPFTHVQRAKVTELDGQLREALKGVIV